jgi:hypothetical protein
MVGDGLEDAGVHVGGRAGFDADLARDDARRARVHLYRQHPALRYPGMRESYLQQVVEVGHLARFRR